MTLSALLWKNAEQAEVLSQLAQIVKYAWEPDAPDEAMETAEDTAGDIQQLASDNVAYGLNENHQWDIAA